MPTLVQLVAKAFTDSKPAAPAKVTSPLDGYFGAWAQWHLDVAMVLDALSASDPELDRGAFLTKCGWGDGAP